mmetsp:Transcript_19584/g.33854  ORF Transcript_19584/g.33854 Transcript_19584/m.33854 type:complete len:214 (-) Transcript_19584:1092-1733(-)
MSWTSGISRPASIRRAISSSTGMVSSKNSSSMPLMVSRTMLTWAGVKLAAAVTRRLEAAPAGSKPMASTVAAVAARFVARPGVCCGCATACAPAPGAGPSGPPSSSSLLPPPGASAAGSAAPCRVRLVPRGPLLLPSSLFISSSSACSTSSSISPTFFFKQWSRMPLATATSRCSKVKLRRTLQAAVARRMMVSRERAVTGSARSRLMRRSSE